MSEGEKDTFAIQLSLQLLVFVGELFVRQQDLMVQLGPFGRAGLKGGSVSIISEDSRRVIFTRPSFNYSIRISGTVRYSGTRILQCLRSGWGLKVGPWVPLYNEHQGLLLQGRSFDLTRRHSSISS